MYYLDSNIPVYLYENNTVIFCEPEQSEITYPPKKYIDLLLEGEKRISYCSTEYGVYYGLLRLDYVRDSYLVFGPIGYVPFLDADLNKMYRDYVIPGEKIDLFWDFLGKIPPLSLWALISKMIFINYCLNGETLSPRDYSPAEDAEMSRMSSVVEENYKNKEDSFHNVSYEIEYVIMNFIRTGNTEGIRKINVNTSSYHTGILSQTAIRQLKNEIIVTTTLATRAAIEGGLDFDTAYNISDKFIQAAEQTQDADSLNNLMSTVAYTFAEKVKEAKTPVTSNDRIQKAIRFIQQNTNRHITVSDVADYVGFSRSYFLSYFKRELGFSVGAFIIRCRLEEARQLLQYTDKTINHISDYLCFASQSHFQTAFKKQFGVTPMQYRNNPVLKK